MVLLVLVERDMHLKVQIEMRKSEERLKQERIYNIYVNHVKCIHTEMRVYVVVVPGKAAAANRALYVVVII